MGLKARLFVGEGLGLRVEKMRYDRGVRLLMVGALAVAVLGAWQTPARASNPEGLVRSYINKQLSRLQLTPAQKPKLMRNLAMTSASRRKIFDDLGVRLGRSVTTLQALQLQSRIWSLAKKAKARMKKILTPKQLKVYDAIRAEVKALLQRRLST